MVAVRGLAIVSSAFFFRSGCAAHDANLVAQNAARVPVCVQAVSAALFSTMCFTRSTCAHALLRTVPVRLPAARLRMGPPKT